MKADLTTLGSYAQSQAKKLGPKEKAKLKDMASGLLPDGLKDKKVTSGPDYKLDLSSKAPSLEAPSLPTPSLPSAPSLPDLPKPKLEAKDPVPEEVKKEIKKEVVETKKVEEKEGTLKKPVIIFIKGLDVFSSPSKSETGYAGVGRIAESIKGSRIYGWNQKDEIIKEIKKVELKQPVVLVGHSLGGDTAVEVANELDSLKHKFRTVDLLVTMDAVGFGNDIIPQNVKRHLNIFGEKDSFLNDGPHVARRNEKTIVQNILSPLDHTDLDDDKEVQFEMVNLIQETLNGVS